ncbi:MAG: permease-like cell division protein FtsX [Pseudomonadota bacterium]
MNSYLLRHLQVFLDTLGRMWAAPAATLLTMSILGIALALPLVLLKIADSLQQVAGNWQGKPEISVFLSMDAGGDLEDLDQRAISYGQNLLNNPAIDDIQYISPQQALEEFKESSGFGSAVDQLSDNPLPPLLVIYPNADQSLEDIQKLVQDLEERADVDSANFDHRWLQRLGAIVDLFRFAVLILALVMSVGVVLIVSNTVRMSILDRSDEIEIVNQVGGTEGFIRRPFLYQGFLQGALGGLIGILISSAILFLLSRPVEQLATLYQSQFRIGWLDQNTALIALVAISCLGWLAARLTVDRHLRSLRVSARGK